MRRFLIRSSAFAAILIALVGGVAASVVIAEIRAYRRELAAPPGATVVVCGDSQTETGLDPSVWPELFNFSASGRTLDQDALVAEDVLSANPGIRVLLVDVSPLTASVDPSAPIGKMDFASRYYLLHWLHLDRQIRSLKGSLRTFRDCMVKDCLKKAVRACFCGHRLESPLRGGFHSKKGELAVTRPETYQKRLVRKIEQMRTAPKMTESLPAFGLLDSLVAVAGRHRARLVLMSTPWREDLVGAVAPEKVQGFSESLRKYAADRGLTYVDFFQERFDGTHWHDCNHLNAEGARRLTEMVRRRLLDRGIGETAL